MKDFFISVGQLFYKNRFIQVLYKNTNFVGKIVVFSKDIKFRFYRYKNLNLKHVINGLCEK